jgi:hypothetical protein
MSVRLFVRMEQPASHWKDFNDILHFSIFRKPVEKIQVSLKWDKNNGYFMCRSIVESGDLITPSDHLISIFVINFKRYVCFVLKAG